MPNTKTTPITQTAHPADVKEDVVGMTSEKAERAEFRAAVEEEYKACLDQPDYDYYSESVNSDQYPYDSEDCYD